MFSISPLELEAIQLIDTAHLWAEDESLHTTSHLDAAVFQDMKHHGNGLLHCLNTNSFLFLPPAETTSPNQRLTCRIVFRPLALRQSEQELAQSPQDTESPQGTENPQSRASVSAVS